MRRRRKPPAPPTPVPPSLDVFDPAVWQSPEDDHQNAAFRRWHQTRNAWFAAHPEVDKLERIRQQMRARRAAAAQSDNDRTIP